MGKVFQLTATLPDRPDRKPFVVATGNKSTVTAIMNRLKQLNNSKFEIKEVRNGQNSLSSSVFR